MKGLVQFICDSLNESQSTLNNVLNEALEKEDLIPIIKRMFAGFKFAKADEKNAADLLIDHFNEGDEYNAEAVDGGFVISKNGKPECNVAVFVNDRTYKAPSKENVKDVDYVLIINKIGKSFKFIPCSDL